MLAVKERRFETEWAEEQRTRKECCRQLRSTLIRRLAEIRREVEQLSEAEPADPVEVEAKPLDRIAAGGAAVLAEALEEVEAAGIDLASLAEQLKQLRASKQLRGEFQEVALALSQLQELLGKEVESSSEAPTQKCLRQASRSRSRRRSGHCQNR